MKKLALLVIPVFFLFLSCEQGDVFPRVENITNGGKWTLKIGSSPAEVYKQLQELDFEKKIKSVGVSYRQPFSKPEEIQSDIVLYDAITLETTRGSTERVLIQFDKDKVNSIETGGSLSDAVTKWPKDAPNEVAIHINDLLDKLYDKLLTIYKIPRYKDYQIILPDKPLKKGYDINMENYDEWHFVFGEDINNAEKDGRYTVDLYFKNKKLVKIRTEYGEFEVVN